jgi:hypothetical protein
MQTGWLLLLVPHSFVSRSALDYSSESACSYDYVAGFSNASQASSLYQGFCISLISPLFHERRIVARAGMRLRTRDTVRRLCRSVALLLLDIFSSQCLIHVIADAAHSFDVLSGSPRRS